MNIRLGCALSGRSRSGGEIREKPIFTLNGKQKNEATQYIHYVQNLSLVKRGFIFKVRV